MKARLPKGYGKQNMNDMMQQAQKMQEQMQVKQDELQETEYTVNFGGGLVEVIMKGTHKITAIKIKPEIVDAEDIEMLEDMIAAAVNEAVRTVDEASETELAVISGGYNIPGL